MCFSFSVFDMIVLFRSCFSLCGLLHPALTLSLSHLQSVLLEIHAAQSQSVMKYLTMYKLRSKIKIIAKHGDYKVLWTLFFST